MTKNDVHLIFEYDSWANNRILRTVSALTAEHFTRDLRGGFRSVRDTLVHIIGGEWGWLTYWKEASPSSAFLTDLWNRHDALFTADAFPGVASVQLKRAEIEEEQVEFMSNVTNESLERMLPFHTTQVKLAQLMQHMVNHSTYHRGQIALMVRQIGAEPAKRTFICFWWTVGCFVNAVSESSQGPGSQCLST